MRLILLLSITFIISQACNTQLPSAADLIFYNGHVVTVDNSFSTGTAIAIKSGRVLKVGAGEILSSYRDSTTKVIDLKGRTILPGLIEPHTHPVAGAQLYSWVDVSGMKHKTARQALNALKKAVRKTPKGQWVLAFGWDMMLLEGGFPLTKEYLDKNISSEHPIWVMMQSMHTHYFNSMAFNLAGITESIKDPAGGGYYERDANGKLTGIVTESATLGPILSVMPQTKRRDVKRLIKDMYTRYNANGITTIGVTGMIEIFSGHNAFEICQEIGKEDFTQLRVFVYDVGGGPVDSIPQSDSWQFRKLGKKFWVDGSPYTGSMLMRRPYVTSEINQEKLNIPIGSYGHTMLPAQAYQNLFEQSQKFGWQISAHSQGDSSCAITIDAFDKMLQTSPKTDHRHRMEHLALVTEDQLRQMADLGVTPSFHINHLYYYGNELASGIIGGGRAERLMPVGAAAKLGHKFSLHNDSPMYPPKPLLAARTAITRRTKDNLILGSDQQISIDDAIRAITINSAWQLFAEDEIGSLEPGKRADMVILEQNPLTIRPTNLEKIKVVATYVDGVKVY